MELRKYFYKSYHAKPKIKLKKILNDSLFFKRSLILKMALNKNIKINTNYKINRLTEKNLSYSKKQDNNDESFENKLYDKIMKKKNLLYELEKILEDNTKKTEKFVESFKDLKEENAKFITGYEDIKIPVEERIKKFIFNTLKIFSENKLDLQLKSRNNPNNNLIEKENDLNDLWAQNKAAVKLFKQCPLTLNDEKDIYFYYIANHLGEKLNINEHKYVKYMKQIKDYLDYLKNQKASYSSTPKKKKNKKNKKIFKEKEINDNKKEKKDSIIKNIKKIPLTKIQNTNIKLYAKNKLNDQENLIKSNDNCNNNSNDSKFKNTSRNNFNSTQEYPSKDTFNIVSISNIDSNNLFNIHKIKNLSCNNTPYNKNSNNNINNLTINKNNNNEDFKLSEKINVCNSSKKINYNHNYNYSSKNSFQDLNNILHRISSDNLTNGKKNSLSVINMRKQTSPKKTGNQDKIFTRNYNKSTTMNFFKYINDMKRNEKNKDFINSIKNKEKINHKSSQHLDEFKILDEDEPIKTRNNNSYDIVNLYEKAKKNNSLNKTNLEEINKFLKSKGIKNEEILKGIQFNSDDAFTNLKSKTNKLNIEAKTKAFFYGFIPNDRKRKLEQLKDINYKINQIEREYIKTLIDKDLHINK
jgi:hypothetical protein